MLPLPNTKNRMITINPTILMASLILERVASDSGKDGARAIAKIVWTIQIIAVVIIPYHILAILRKVIINVN